MGLTSRKSVRRFYRSRLTKFITAKDTVSAAGEKVSILSSTDMLVTVQYG